MVNLLRKTGGQFAPESGPETALSKVVNLLRNQVVNLTGFSSNHPVFIVYCKDNKMRWWKKSDDFPYYSLFEFGTEPPDGTVAFELFTTNKVYFGDEKKQDIWKSDWFKMKDDERDKRFYEYCLYVKSYNYTISVIWED